MGRRHRWHMSDADQGRLASKMLQLTHGDLAAPIVTMGWNAERYQGRNLALRLVALGYTNVYWYRGGVNHGRLPACPVPQSRCRAGNYPDRVSYPSVLQLETGQSAFHLLQSYALSGMTSLPTNSLDLKPVVAVTSASLNTDSG